MSRSHEPVPGRSHRKRRSRASRGGVLLALLIALGASVSHGADAPPAKAGEIRVGYFANITHAQAIVGLAKGTFRAELGERIAIKPTIFNAGPSVIEALFANEIDVAYVGPNPAVNGFVKSGGNALRVVAGACSGGARLIVRPGAGIHSPSDFHGKRLATPQLGNTQDVAARNWLAAQGLAPREKGGDVQILPIANADQLALFQRGEIDAVWAVEPWASRLVQEGKGQVFLDERSLWPDGRFTTGVVVVNTRYLQEHSTEVKSWLTAHVTITRWIHEHPSEAKHLLNEEISRMTGKPLPDKILNEAYSTIEITDDPVESSITRSARLAFELGFLGRQKPELQGLFDLRLLREIKKAPRTAHARLSSTQAP